jgi:hypothetical protein
MGGGEGGSERDRVRTLTRKKIKKNKGQREKRF